MHAFSQSALFLTVTLPAAGALLVLVFARWGIELTRQIALTNVLLTFAMSVVVICDYDPNQVDASGHPQLIQMQTNFRWVESLDSAGNHVGPEIQFALGVDGLSLWLIGLSALLMIPAVLVSWEAVADRPASFYSLILLLQSGLIGGFS